ncbi:hypothetical protein N7519_005741 [Penicillium mononematosum]|uniref:uncharacterized protein n=1 Tax=Penicillium mononematosum TaxID=268346 RepID=UPI002549A68F|nr:uncharacterized protein N7519_005741 [Penicillium mononematosum]KAJ6184440.1 hypothetical protein N7519_005741 [Penicillium mononematosum]
MPSPAKVCYADPLNIVSKRNTNLHLSSSTQDASFDGLLRRCDFDWAEDVEDADISGNLPITATADPLDYCLSKETLYDEIHYSPRHLAYRKYKPSLPTIPEEVWDEPWGWVHGTPDITSNPSQRILAESHDDTTQHSTYEGSRGNSESDLHLVTQQSINNIFADRQAWIEADEEIHHFNWMGLRVYAHSSTSPSESLAIIFAKPKSLQGSAMWRVHSVLNRAVRYIDPVLVLLDDADESLLELRGSELVRASTGRVFKFYSPHGSWLEDSNDPSEETTTDFGNVRTYEAADLVIGNGFVESAPIPSVFQWAPQPITIKKPKKPPRKITTCVAGAPPEEYFSFPTPVFGRRRPIKQAFAKARRGLTSAFTSLKTKLS